MADFTESASFRLLRDIKKDTSVELVKDADSVLVCPDMGGRTFASVCGIAPHRMDMECIKNPNQPFNNFGGGTIWPAPEGGRFGFNYDGDTWRVQPAINNEPFTVVSQSSDSVILEKRVNLSNRAGTVLDTVMRREVSLVDHLPSVLQAAPVKGWLSYKTHDRFEALNRVSTEEALLAAWTLEQFDTSNHTEAFCIVENPHDAINFDFYAHPGERISYYEHGFCYRTDGQGAGQIGIKQSASASFVGFRDVSRGIVCIRENRSPEGGIFFNIADNAQPDGPYSAADNYSIFNSDPDMQAFELETVGSALLADGLLKGSELVSITSFAVYQNPGDAVRLVDQLLGGRS